MLRIRDGSIRNLSLYRLLCGKLLCYLNWMHFYLIDLVNDENAHF